MSQRLIDVGIEVAGNRLAFYGPSEFKVMRANDDSAWVATNALPLLLASGSRPDQGVVIRPWAEKREGNSSQETSDAKGRSRGAGQSMEMSYLGHLEIVHPSSREVLVELTGEVKVDPFSAPTDEDEYDPAKALTHLMESLMRKALAELTEYAPERNSSSAPFPYVLALTPKTALAYQGDSQTAFETTALGKLDALEADLVQQSRARFACRTLSDLDAAKAVRLPPGLLVVEIPAEGSKLSKGDVLLQIDQDPALPQRLARQWLTGLPVQVKVRKAGGGETEVVLP
ncbi:MAG: hypothetical protein K1X64_04495 [Myxococcaceae bacterium]|nr:hypothetical protein [Myxococcaceae bacterium]